jgi:hypothetical protein
MSTALVLTYLLVLALVVLGAVWRKEVSYAAIAVVAVLLALALAGIRI